jgi:tRNA modification GTPase
MVKVQSALDFGPLDFGPLDFGLWTLDLWTLIPLDFGHLDFGLSSTIIAIASPPGRSARGIIRITGAHAFEWVRPHLEAASDEQGRRPSEEDAGGATKRRGPHRARLTLSAFRRFPVSAFLFPAPRSYTGEDSIELQVPGNPALLNRIIDALIASGRSRELDVRRAEPGEFTARAYFNGRLSLTQAEGVAATIAAQSDAELRAAQLLTSGRLGTVAHQLADALASALALVEAGIDFTDQDDVVAIAPRDLWVRLTTLYDAIRSQLDHAVGSEQLQAIPWVVLVGEPNAGKSALFNVLLGRERAVVSPTAGTTRDVLAEPLTIQTDHAAAEVMLVDLAGLDEADESSMNRLMQVAAREAIDRAELSLRCVPIDQPAPIEVSTHELLVRTKTDLIDPTPKLRQSEIGSEGDNRATPRVEITVSAHTGHGLDQLRAAIAARLSTRAVSLAADALALRPRHEAAFRAALAHLSEATALVEAVRDTHNLPNPELIASTMRAALDDLSSLAGDITPDDILGRVFATFCVGK